MTQDEIIRMAWKTGLVIDGNFSGNDDLFAFANLVAAAEREECAKVCDEEAREAYAAESVFLPQGNPLLIKIAEGARRCGNAIRARGNK
jgi:hypothetical protein